MANSLLATAAVVNVRLLYHEPAVRATAAASFCRAARERPGTQNTKNKKGDAPGPISAHPLCIFLRSPGGKAAPASRRLLLQQHEAAVFDGLQGKGIHI
jgi:hypothetical protein